MFRARRGKERTPHKWPSFPFQISTNCTRDRLSGIAIVEIFQPPVAPQTKERSREEGKKKRRCTLDLLRKRSNALQSACGSSSIDMQDPLVKQTKVRESTRVRDFNPRHVESFPAPRTSTKTEPKYLTETKCRDLILRSRVFEGSARRGEGHRGTVVGKRKENFIGRVRPHGSIPDEEFVRVHAISAAGVCVCVHEPTRPQANTRTLLFREIATRPRRFKRLPNEVWLRKHGTYTRARGRLHSAKIGQRLFRLPRGLRNKSSG